jgi:hypothetical protein
MPRLVSGPEFDLAGLDELYAQAGRNAEDYNSDIADGTYHVVIDEARLTQTVTTNRPIVIWTLRFLDPPYTHRKLSKNRVITDKTLGYLKEDLAKCGLVLRKLSDLPERIGEMAQRHVLLEKRTSHGKAELYFRWPDRAAHEPEEDLPF